MKGISVNKEMSDSTTSGHAPEEIIDLLRLLPDLVWGLTAEVQHSDLDSLRCCSAGRSVASWPPTSRFCWYMRPDTVVHSRETTACKWVHGCSPHNRICQFWPIRAAGYQHSPDFRPSRYTQGVYFWQQLVKGSRRLERSVIRYSCHNGPVGDSRTPAFNW